MPLHRILARPRDRATCCQPLRDPEDLKPIASFACSFMLTAIRITIAKFRPTEDLEPWYKREVQQRYHAVTRKGP